MLGNLGHNKRLLTTIGSLVILTMLLVSREEANQMKITMSVNMPSALNSSSTLQPVGVSNSERRKLPLPVKLLRQYVRNHGVEALKANPHGRKYAIAMYVCPDDAGNSLHQFANGLLYSMLTNRTLLWYYGDNSKCTTRKAHKNIYCQQRYAERFNCSRTLQRAKWMAEWEEWKDKVLLDDDEAPFMVAVTDWPPNPDRQHEPIANTSFYGFDDVLKYPQRVFVWPRIYFQYSLLGSSNRVRNKLLQTQKARRMVDQLFSLGADVLYGMLHRHAFQMSETILNTVPQVEHASNYYTIALHSRHRFATLDGCDIQREVHCLQSIVNSGPPTDKPIRVSMMSDRACTLTHLSQWLNDRNITTVNAPHNDTSFDRLAEHGPFAGAGFYVDLAMVLATVQDAFIGMERSSSQVVREMLEFDRLMRSMETKGNVTSGLATCTLPIVGPGGTIRYDDDDDDER